MCIACGGTCGGVGDVLLPSLVAGVGLVVLRVRAGRKRSNAEFSEPSSPDEPAVVSDHIDRYDRYRD